MSQHRLSRSLVTADQHTGRHALSTPTTRWDRLRTRLQAWAPLLAASTVSLAVVAIVALVTG